jgi:hypothetical protein
MVMCLDREILLEMCSIYHLSATLIKKDAEVRNLQLFEFRKPRTHIKTDVLQKVKETTLERAVHM